MAIANPYGTISLLLRDQVRVDMTVDRGIRVFNFKVSDLTAVNKQGYLPNALQMQANNKILFHLVITQKNFLPRTLKKKKVRYEICAIFGGKFLILFWSNQKLLFKSRDST